MAQRDKPFHRISMTRSKLEMWAEHGDRIFSDPSEKDQLLRDACFTVGALMDFRNIINGMVGFDELPQDAARPYVDD